MIDNRHGHLMELRILAVLALVALGGLWILATGGWGAVPTFVRDVGAILLLFIALAAGQILLDRVGWGLFSLFGLAWLGTGLGLWSAGLPGSVAALAGGVVGCGAGVGMAALVRERRLRTLQRLLGSPDGDPERIAGLIVKLEDGVPPLTAERIEAAPELLRVAAEPGEHQARLMQMLTSVRRPSDRLRGIVRASRDDLPEWERNRVDRWLDTTG